MVFQEPTFSIESLVIIYENVTTIDVGGRSLSLSMYRRFLGQYWLGIGRGLTWLIESVAVEGRKREAENRRDLVVVFEEAERDYDTLG